MEYLIFRECDFSFVPSLRKLTTFKFGMVFGNVLGSENEIKINNALLEVGKSKTFNKRINNFFNEEKIDYCPKTTMKYRDNYK